MIAEEEKGADPGLSGRDRSLLRDLARRVADIAALPVMAERRDLWRRHNLVGAFDEGKIRRYIARTLDVTKGCVLEMILKDTHTCERHPERFTRWTEIARDLVDAW